VSQYFCYTATVEVIGILQPGQEVDDLMDYQLLEPLIAAAPNRVGQQHFVFAQENCRFVKAHELVRLAKEHVLDPNYFRLYPAED
jgi:hypothetical protein